MSVEHTAARGLRPAAGESPEARGPSPEARRFSKLYSLAWRESRTARRRLALYMSSISLGVAAMVAIDSFASNVTSSVRAQARSVLGGDLSLNSNEKFTPAADTVLDSLRRAGMQFVNHTTFGSMARIGRTQGVRFSTVHAISDGYPLYGTVRTEPDGVWKTLHTGAHAVIDEVLLVTLDGQIGDTLSLGYGKFEITGVIRDMPGETAFSGSFAPRVYIPERYLAETQLLVFGSRAQYERLGKSPAGKSTTELVRPFRAKLRREHVRSQTVEEREKRLTTAVGNLSDFLGIVGLMALLLGGVGVASGVSAFVSRKIDTVAVLRCVGATSGQVLLIYALQAGVMGLFGATVGVAIGIFLQFMLPVVAKDLLPVDVSVSLVWPAILLGLAIGVFVALAFALRPLLGLRHVSPLQALRRDADESIRRRRWTDIPTLIVDLTLVGGVVGMALARSESTRNAIGISVGVGVALLVLWLSAAALARLARRMIGKTWPYVVRQGVANLYRPANQTRAVVLSLGFGAFLITTLYLVQANILHRLDITQQESKANLTFFDIQEDQAAGVSTILQQRNVPLVEKVPIVTMRMDAVNGVSTAEYARRNKLPRDFWVFRREYRSTYRTKLTSTEKIVAGKWFGTTPATSLKLPVGAPAPMGELSLDGAIAEEAKLKVGDIITWDVQGRRIPVRLTSLREINWERFEPNFFAVFTPAAIEAAPKQWVVTAVENDPRRVALLQREIVDRYPNVSSVDLSLIRNTIAKIVERVSLAIRFLAVFSLAVGIPVLFSAVAATRRQRIREGVLLKTLGATRAQIGRIMLAEYALLGLLGSLTGMVLAFGGSWSLVHFVFKQDYTVVVGAALAIAAVTLALTLGIGLLGGRDVFAETPMAALREN